MNQAAPATTRERLLRSAHDLLGAGGYAPASVGAIAERADLATGALYRHFASKAELFIEVFRSVAEEELAAMVAAADRAGDFAGRLEAVIRTYAGSALGNRHLAWALVYEPVDPLVDAERLACRRRFCDGMAELLRDGVRTGAIPDQDVEITAAAVIGAIAEALVGPLSPLPGTAPSEDRIIAAIVGFCRRAVGLDDGSAEIS